MRDEGSEIANVDRGGGIANGGRGGNGVTICMYDKIMFRALKKIHT